MIIVIESALLPVLLLPLSSFFVLHCGAQKKRQTQFPNPPACGVVPENHSRTQSEWFFSVDFSNRFRLIGVFSLILLSTHTHTSVHAHTQPHPHTHTLPALSLVYFIFQSKSYSPTPKFRHSKEEARKKKKGNGEQN